MKLVSMLVLLGSVLSPLGCGGEAVVDPGGGGQGGTSTTSSGTTSSGTTSTTGGCSSHDDCPGQVCLFVTGQCAPACQADACDSCGPGQFCEPCATSSCPSCKDCRAACVAITAGRCDEDDPCPAGQVCEWYSGTCLDDCQTDADCGAFSYCEPCATSSCCGCEDCDSACLGGE